MKNAVGTFDPQRKILEEYFFPHTLQYFCTVVQQLCIVTRATGLQPAAMMNETEILFKIFCVTITTAVVQI